MYAVACSNVGGLALCQRKTDGGRQMSVYVYVIYEINYKTKNMVTVSTSKEPT